MTDWEKAYNELKKFSDAHSEIISEIAGLTPGILERDLERAKNYQKGYYKNKKGVYWHVKGIEVTNDIGNLLRMGFNGEDRGVWIHYCEVTDHSIKDNDVPVCSFCSLFDARFTSADQLMRRTTKEDYENKVAEVTKTVLSDYVQKREVSEYLSFMRKFVKLCSKCINLAKERGNVATEELPES
ncbi:MAG: hypothetical protein J6X18_00130 [Bacteroidales bacterium]|nr:hypothetical protein [Bacteroidales bacterium]